MRKGISNTMELWAIAGILIVVIVYHFSIQLSDDIQVFMDPAISEQISNGLFVWVIGLLWIAYQRYRKISKRGRILEDAFASTGQEVMLVVGSDGRIVLCNDVVQSLFGVTSEEVVGRKSDRLIGDRRNDEGNPNEIEEALGQFGFHRGETIGRKRDGEEIAIEVHTGRRKKGDGHVLLIHDITERKQADEKVRIAKKQAEQAYREKEEALVKLESSYRRLRELENHRDNLIHMVCHDMKAPLQVLILQLDLLKEMVIEKLDNDELESVDTLLAYSRQLEVMVYSMLDLSRMEDGKLPLRMKKMHMRETLTEGIRLMKTMRPDVEFSLHIDENLPDCTFDPDVMQRVVANILLNAAKYSPPDEMVMVSADLGEKDFVRISVTDKGPGVPKDFHEKIFEKFGQVHLKGHQRKGSTGLGLAFCRMAVEAHGGRIGLISTEGAGSTFWFVVPLAANEESQSSVVTGAEAIEE